MREPISYEAWRASAVFCSDLRPFHAMLDGYELQHCTERSPGAVFMIMEFNDVHTYHPTGVIFQNIHNGLWLVQVCQDEREFTDFDMASKWLWDEHWKGEIGPPPPTRFRLLAVDNGGNIINDETCESEDHMVEAAWNIVNDADLFPELGNALTTIGSRYFEFPQGHIVAFPLE